VYRDKKINISSPLEKKAFAYNQNSIEINKNDPENFWKILKRIVKPKEKQISELYFPGHLETDQEIIAKKFNDYFIDSVLDMHNTIGIMNITPLYPFNCFQKMVDSTFGFSLIGMYE
jgi:hypothetical protein